MPQMRKWHKFKTCLQLNYKYLGESGGSSWLEGKKWVLWDNKIPFFKHILMEIHTISCIYFVSPPFSLMLFWDCGVAPQYLHAGLLAAISSGQDLRPWERKMKRSLFITTDICCVKTKVTVSLSLATIAYSQSQMRTVCLYIQYSHSRIGTSKGWRRSLGMSLWQQNIIWTEVLFLFCFISLDMATKKSLWHKPKDSWPLDLNPWPTAFDPMQTRPVDTGHTIYIPFVALNYMYFSVFLWFPSGERSRIEIL